MARLTAEYAEVRMSTEASFDDEFTVRVPWLVHTVLW